VGVHGSLGLARGSRGVDDQRVIAGLPDGRSADRDTLRGGPGQLVNRQHGRTGTERIRSFAVTGGENRSGDGNHVVDLGSRCRRVHRHEDRAGAQHGYQGLDGGNGGPGGPQDAVARGDATLGQGCCQRGRTAVEQGGVNHACGVPPVYQHR
jgi:hypothetical protein